MLSATLLHVIFLSVLIFSARILDVTFGTLRIIYISRGFKFLASLIGFIEILIWLLAITQIMKNLNNPVYFLAYAGGFATGTFIGLSIENKIAMGIAILRIISMNMPDKLIECLKEKGHRLTIVPAHGAFQPVKLIFMIVKRKNIHFILELIKQYDPKSVYTIEDVRSVSPDLFPALQPDHSKIKRKLFFFSRKDK
jgi:uncharacterized protein YebE (UPF0316 family)